MTRSTIVFVAAVTAVLVGHSMTARASEAQKTQVRANFQAADTNRDIALAPLEFVTFINLNARYGIGRSRMIQRFGGYEMAFERVDANRDGFVTPDELAAAASRNF